MSAEPGTVDAIITSQSLGGEEDGGSDNENKGSASSGTQSSHELPRPAAPSLATWIATNTGGHDDSFPAAQDLATGRLNSGVSANSKEQWQVDFNNLMAEARIQLFKQGRDEAASEWAEIEQCIRGDPRFAAVPATADRPWLFAKYLKEQCHLEDRVLRHLRLDVNTKCANPIGQLSGRRKLYVTYWHQPQSLPDSIGQLSSLQELCLMRCRQLQSLPDSIGQLSSLQSLDLRGCKQLQSLPDSIGQLSSLQSLDLRGCKQLQSLPDSIGQLSSLQSLDLRGCEQLQSLPDVSQLSKITELNAANCSRLKIPFEHLPDHLQNQQLTTRAKSLLSQADTLRATMGAVSWIAILLATASYVGFITAPGGSLDGGLIKLSDDSDEDGEFGNVRMNSGVLRAYCVCNLVTFFLALTTALYAVIQTMPHPFQDTARGVVWKITISFTLLLLAIFTGVATFMCGVLAVLPSDEHRTIWIAAIPSGCVLVGSLLYYIRRLKQLWYVVGFRGPPPPDQLPVGPMRDSQEVLLANLLAEMKQLSKALLQKQS